MTATLRLGTRGSPLALWQANWVRDHVMAAQPECAIEIEVIRTSAEIFPEKSIARIGVGVFTQELDEALFDGRIDLAVHSLKDLASTLDSRLCLAAVPAGLLSLRRQGA